MEKIRLNKYLSECGICSRREADRLAEAGRITVNGAAAFVGMSVCESDEIVVDGKLIKPQKKKQVLLAVNKPKGVVCTTARFKGEQNIVDMVQYPTRIYPIGRLDKDSEGLILMLLISYKKYERKFKKTIDLELTLSDTLNKKVKI